MFGVQLFPASPFERPSIHAVLSQVDFVEHVAHTELALMALVPPGVLPPVLERLEVPGANALQSTHAGTRDLVVQRLSGGTVRGQSGIALDGEAGYLVEGTGEAVLHKGTLLAAYGVDHVRVTGGAASVSVSGGVIRATGPVGASYAVFSPTATSVTVNGVAVPFTRNGRLVLFS